VNDILLTGLPRSGTTLMCACINRLPDCLALAEPISPPTHGNVAAAMECVSAFLSATRERALRDRRVTTKTSTDGFNTANWFEAPAPGGRLRRSSEKINDLSLDKVLTPNFKMIVKQPGFFTALAQRLTVHYPLYAMVRHPLAVLASWQTVDMPVNSGRWPVAEAFSRHLRSGLEALSAPLDRQVFILNWCFEVYKSLPQERVIRYEDLVASPTTTLAKIVGTAGEINYPFHLEGPETRYPSVNLPDLARVLLPFSATFEIFYPRFEDGLSIYLDRA
jgi:Sulfotransferase family